MHLESGRLAVLHGFNAVFQCSSFLVKYCAFIVHFHSPLRKLLPGLSTLCAGFLILAYTEAIKNIVVRLGVQRHRRVLV